MDSSVQIDIVTIFPAMLSGFLGESMLKRAAENNIVKFRMIDPRDFTADAHRTVDDRPYGGGPGMVMKPEPICLAVESVLTEQARVLLTTPQGRKFDQQAAVELAGSKHIILVCGHYEGIDERAVEEVVTDEFSIGDYVLTNGALAAAVIIDAVVRLLPGARGCAEGARDDSFNEGLLEHPQYTRPAEFRNRKVPEILLSGDHKKIKMWRRMQAEKRTKERRPDLL
ncbi:MAG: tRNA (guanosine(37)-N1)-methyltransferase TrmD [Lentisphaerae bacterium]|nr:tRNA (guanosine(37)-N1)-methyltransferase TrmD [Lentisphaerota bacterium]